MSHNGWFPRIALDLTIAAAVSFALAMLIPLSVWQSLGSLATSFLILGFAAAATTALVLRQRGAWQRISLGEPVRVQAE